MPPFPLKPDSRRFANLCYIAMEMRLGVPWGLISFGGYKEVRISIKCATAQAPLQYRCAVGGFYTLAYQMIRGPTSVSSTISLHWTKDDIKAILGYFQDCAVAIPRKWCKQRNPELFRFDSGIIHTALSTSPISAPLVPTDLLLFQLLMCLPRLKGLT